MAGREGLFEASLYALAGLLFLAGHGLPSRGDAGFEPGPRTAGTYRIVTWNVGASSGRGGRALRDDELEHVAARLRALEPDLCLLQELSGGRQAQALCELCGPGWSVLLSRSGGDRRLAALAPEGTLAAWPLPRGVRRGLGLVHRREGRPALGGVVLHAHAFSSVWRNGEVGLALEALFAQGEGAPAFLAGDLNLDLDLDKRRDLFTDDEYRDVETYNYAAGRLVDAALGTGATAEPDRRLDYVFVNGDLFAVERAAPWRGQRAGDMDHDPVVADLAFRP